MIPFLLLENSLNFLNFNSLHVHNKPPYYIQKPSLYSSWLLSYTGNYGVALLLMGTSSPVWGSIS
jgi:hypothetical protein